LLSRSGYELHFRLICLGLELSFRGSAVVSDKAAGTLFRSSVGLGARLGILLSSLGTVENCLDSSLKIVGVSRQETCPMRQQAIGCFVISVTFTADGAGLAIS
jgi:hypothetical protein